MAGSSERRAQRDASRRVRLESMRLHALIGIADSRFTLSAGCRSAREGDQQKIHRLTASGFGPRGTLQGGVRLKRISISILGDRGFSTTRRCPMQVPTNQSPSCNWKRQRLVRSEDSRLNYRRNTIYWKLSRRRRCCTLDIPPEEGNMLTICKEKRGLIDELPLFLAPRSAPRFKMYKPKCFRVKM